MQLLLTTRPWMVLARALIQIDDLPEEVRNEQFLHLFLLGAAAGKEASDAFRECDRLGVFDEMLVTSLGNVPDPLARARRECNMDDADSLLKSVLERTRNNAGFHWSRKLLQRALSHVSGLELHAARGGTTNFDSAIPIGEVLAGEVLRSQNVSPDDLRDIFPRIAALLDSLRHIADTAVALTIYNSLEDPD